MKRLLTVSLLLAAVSWFLPAAPAQAASAIQFGRIQYDSPGSDTRTNASINAEYVQIKNLGTAAVTLTGWTVRDAANHVYKFGTYKLAGKQTLTLRTGKGTNSATVRYWGSAAYIWNNDTDKAWIKSAGGTQADYCVWTATAPGYKNC